MSGARSQIEAPGAFEVISRLVGGAAVHTITLTAMLPERGWRPSLVTGLVEEGEDSVAPLARDLGVDPIVFQEIRRPPRPRDLRAIRRLRSLIRRERPGILHTHGAKGGAIGRGAALLAGRERPALVHSFHGHVLLGYFGPRASAAFLRIERSLARRTDAIVVPAAAVREELVELGVAPASKIRVIPYGFDLTAFEPPEGPDDPVRAEVRSSLGIRPGEQVVTLVARLARVKRVDRFLRVAGRLGDLDGVRFVIVGSGPDREQLQGSAEARAAGDRIVWAGHRDDMAAVYRASDLMMVTSDHEGAPISLIEGQASGLPAVATDVGGVSEVVRDGETGMLAAVDDEDALAAATRALLEDPGRAASLGAAARGHALAGFSLERMLDDISALYDEVSSGASQGPLRAAWRP